VTLAHWRDLSVILLAIPAFVLSLIPAALLYFCVRGMSMALKKLRTLAPQVQGYFGQTADITEKVSQKVAAPIISASATTASMKHWRTAVFRSRVFGKEV
jgi:hypothetical protein